MDAYAVLKLVKDRRFFGQELSFNGESFSTVSEYKD